MAEVKFDRTPYNVTYLENGEKKVIRRVPPPKLHDGLPQDVVTISHKKNDDWDAGDEAKIVGISSRQPNTLQVENAAGEKTFVSYSDVKFKPRPLSKDAEVFGESGPGEADPIDGNYLLWP